MHTLTSGQWGNVIKVLSQIRCKNTQNCPSTTEFESLDPVSDDDGNIFITRDSFSRCTELVVAESVVVIKKLLQMQPEKHSDIIKHMAKLTDNIQVSASPHQPPAEASGYGEGERRRRRRRRRVISVCVLFARCRWRGPASCG